MSHLNVNFPSTVHITDVTLRDGFQNLKNVVPTEEKIRVIDALVYSGVNAIEVTSFVNPKAVPQMFDASIISKYIRTTYPSVSSIALVPNFKGASLAAENNIEHVSYVMSASAGHNKANINRTHEESLADLQNIVTTFSKMNVTLSMSTVFGCPIDGQVSVNAILNLLKKVKDIGVTRITLCDTIGVANPSQVQFVVNKILTTHDDLDIGLHFHDTHGMALANTFAALQLGIDRFEATAGGLGGCPFAPGATGNVSTEDNLNMLWRMNIKTGIDREKYDRVVRLVAEIVQEPLSSHMAYVHSFHDQLFW